MSSAFPPFLQIALFAIPLTVSPGPNNLMAMSHCAQHGYARTLPALAGISIGATVLFLGVALGLALGLGVVPAAHPRFHATLKFAGAAYILYLSYTLYMSKERGQADRAPGRTITFTQAALLQILNPKIGLLAATAAASFLPLTQDPYRDAAVLSLTLGGIFFPCNSIWAIFGLSLRRFLNSEKSWRRFNRAMGLITASSVIFLF